VPHNRFTKDFAMKTAITCRELIEFLDDYVADRLASNVRERFESHLSVCRHCWDYLATYRETIALARGAMRSETADAAAALPDELVRAILAARAS
jgi:anti-sigma factor RsiW